MSNRYLSCHIFIIFKYIFLLLFDFWTQGPRSSSGPTVPSPCWPNASQVRNLPNRGLKRACHQAQISPTHDSAETVFSQARAQVSFWMTPGCPHSRPVRPLILRSSPDSKLVRSRLVLVAVSSWSRQSTCSLHTVFTLQGGSFFFISHSRIYYTSSTMLLWQNLSDTIRIRPWGFGHPILAIRPHYSDLAKVIQLSYSDSAKVIQQLS